MSHDEPREPTHAQEPEYLDDSAFEDEPKVIRAEISQDDESKKRKKRKRKRRPLGDEDPEYLDKESLENASWWVSSAVIGGIGMLLNLCFLIVLAAKLSKHDHDEAGLGTIGAFIAAGILGFMSLIQVVCLIGILAVVGGFFSIDYGPVLQAIVKLIALVLLVNGVILVVPYAMCLGPVSQVVVCMILLTLLFKLDHHEALVTSGAIVVASFVMQLALTFIIAAKLMHAAHSAKGA